MKEAAGHEVGVHESGSVAVVGAGSIGVGWAIVFARAGMAVSLYDPDGARLDLAGTDLVRRLTALHDHGLSEAAPDVLARRVVLTDELSVAVRAARYVQECAPEDEELKRALFEELDDLVPDGAVLASSSSAILPSRLAAAVSDPSRVLVAHPGNPPYLLPVVELVPSPSTASRTLEAAHALLESAGMSPVCLRREIEGFVFNRLQGAVLREAYCLVRDEVVDAADVDLVMRDGLGRRWAFLGPFETVELNTEGGIPVHARRMGAAYARMGAERGQHDPWTERMVAEVSEAVQGRFPRDRWRDNVLWRDSALMSMEQLRRRTPLPGRRSSPADGSGVGR